MHDASQKVGVFIPVYNAGVDLPRLLDSLHLASLDADVIIVDSSSSDGSAEVARRYTPYVTVIDKNEFDHGGTRQKMVEDNSAYDICVFMTQDAYLASPEAIARIVEAFDDPSVGAVCGRQLPHLDANPLAQHARYFNYPDAFQKKSWEDRERYGIKTAFMSNSFSAYRRKALLEAGGFLSKLILSEDMYIAARMLQKGWSIVYSNTAVCHHSHNYSIVEEFKRYFDIGVFHHDQAWIGEALGGAGGEGLRYVKSELSFLIKQKHWLWLPRSLVTCAAKLAGYKLGKSYQRLPMSLVRKLSMHTRYWRNQEK